MTFLKASFGDCGRERFLLLVTLREAPLMLSMAADYAGERLSANCWALRQASTLRSRNLFTRSENMWEDEVRGWEEGSVSCVSFHQPWAWAQRAPVCINFGKETIWAPISVGQHKEIVSSDVQICCVRRTKIIQEWQRNLRAFSNSSFIFCNCEQILFFGFIHLST